MVRALAHVTGPTAGPPPPKVVAVTGAMGAWARLLVKSLAEAPGVTRVLAMDGRPDDGVFQDLGDRVQYRRVDLTVPATDAVLADLFRREKVGAVVHGAYVLNRSTGQARAHELEVIGTMYVLAAAAAAGVKRLVYTGSTMVYGAHPQNPNFLTEHAPTRGAPGFGFVEDKQEAEDQVQQFQARHPEVQTTILRMCPMLAPHFQNVWTRYIRRAVAPIVMGFDPLMQFLHPEDALRAVKLAVFEDHPGIFNIVGRGVLPLTTVLRLCGTLPVALPRMVGRPLFGALWNSSVGIYPPAMLDYLTYVYVADGEKAAQQLGFIPQYNTRETVLHLMGATQDNAPA